MEGNSGKGSPAWNWTNLIFGKREKRRREYSMCVGARQKGYSEE